jgi:hypothetical protein
MSGAAARPPVAALLAFCAVPLLFHVIIVETSHIPIGLSLGGLFKLGFLSASVLTHWGIYSGLLLTFGLTLRPGHEPLITAMARRMHGELDAELAGYTRAVTIAWCMFFATQLTISVSLFCFAPLVVWSCFVNIFDVPLVAAMFGAEYVFRIWYLKNPPRHSVAAILQMVAEVGQDSKPI